MLCVGRDRLITEEAAADCPALQESSSVPGREWQMDLSEDYPYLGVVNVRHNKEKKPKIVPLLDEDIKLVKSLPRGLPHLYFFRHGKRKGLTSSKAGRFGNDYLYKWWKIACRNLGIEGVDLYGGTRHSSARGLREFCSPEQIKKATMHSTNAERAE
jgi:integrase